MDSKFPWQHIIDASALTAQDSAKQHQIISKALQKLGNLSGKKLSEATKQIKTQAAQTTYQDLEQRRLKLIPDDLLTEIASTMVNSILLNQTLWNEILHYYHTIIVPHKPPMDNNTKFTWIKAIQQQFIESEKYFPSTKKPCAQNISLYDIQKLPRSHEILETIKHRLVEEMSKSKSSPQLKCRIPENAKLLTVYKSAVKLIYQMVENHMHNASYYNHQSIGAGERAFGCLMHLRIMKGVNEEVAVSRYVNSPYHTKFVCRLEDVDTLIDQRKKLAPSLGNIFAAVDYMSTQYSTGIKITKEPAKVSKTAQSFVDASLSAELNQGFL